MAHLRTVCTALVLGWLAVVTSPACSSGSSTTGPEADAGAPDSAVSGNDAPTGDSAGGGMDATTEASTDAGAGSGDGAADASGEAEASVVAEPCLDPTFGTQGLVELAVPNGPYAFNLADLAIQADGKIVVVGTNPTNGATLARFNADGSLDTSYGTLGLVSLPPSSPTVTNSPYAIALQPDGQLLLGSANYDSSIPGDVWELARFGTTGALDTTFGVAGYATAPTAGQLRIDAIAVRSDGHIVIAADQPSTGGDAFLVTQYDATGVLDTSFGTPSPWPYRPRCGAPHRRRADRARDAQTGLQESDSCERVERGLASVLPGMSGEGVIRAAYKDGASYFGTF